MPSRADPHPAPSVPYCAATVAALPIMTTTKAPTRYAWAMRAVLLSAISFVSALSHADRHRTLDGGQRPADDRAEK